MNEINNVDKKALSIWRFHLQDEIDAAFLYRTLAQLVADSKRNKIYLQLAEVEDKHVAIWKEQLGKYNQKITSSEPSSKAKFISWFSKRFGPSLLTRMMLKEEATEVKSYLGLYNSTEVESTKSIALKLAQDSAQHANKLMSTDGVSEEPWHSSESGGMLRNVVYGFNDGLTANFGLIAGMIGATAAPHIILMSGLAGMLADSLSMRRTYSNVDRGEEMTGCWPLALFWFIEQSEE